MSKYAYYPGCSLHATAKEYDLSTRKVSQALGIELVEIDDWNCCGATPAHSSSHLLSLALPARNLARAERSGFETLVSPCAACSSRHKFVNKEINEDQELKAKVNEVLPYPYNGGVEVKNFLDMISEIVCGDNGFDKVKKPLKGLKAVCYYGCLLTRPVEVTEFDNPDNPTSMDKILEVLGAEVLPWFPKTKCCGGSFALGKVELVVERVGQLLKEAKEIGAECIVVACPMCQANLDMRQGEVKRKFKTSYKMPIPYFTELLGVALSLDQNELGLDKHMTDLRPLLRSKNLI